MRLLTAEDVRAALPMQDAIAAVRSGFIALSTGNASVPIRSAIETENGVTLTMPAHLKGAPISSVKIVSVYPDNPQRNLPVVTAAVFVLDAQTGVPLALLDGTALTAIRTGAASGLATDLLARKDSTILAVIGAGAQARTQIEAVCAVRPIRQIRLYSLAHAQSLAEELREKYDAEIIVAPTAREALRDADVIVAATNSKTPVVTLADVKPGAHINGIGSFTPQMQEIAADIVTSARLVVDHRESAWAEAGDLIIPRDQGLITEQDVYAEIGEIAAGLKQGRESDEEITFFKSVGNAVQDAAAAQHVLSQAEARGIGSVVNF